MNDVALPAPADPLVDALDGDPAAVDQADAADAADTADGDRYRVPGLERGLKLLGEFSRSDRELGAPELARRLKLPRTTVFRLLATLEALGFVERTSDGRSFRLGIAVLRLGFEYLASLELTQLGQPVLAALCESVRTPCNLVVRDGRQIVYVAKVSPAVTFSPYAQFTSAVNVGTRLPAHATVLGRVLLEDLTLAELRALYPEPQLEAFSPSTPRSADALFQLVQQDRQRGYVAGEGFFEASISTIAAPVHDRAGRVAAALGATIPTPQIAAERRDALLAAVRAAADELSQRLGCPPARRPATTGDPA